MMPTLPFYDPFAEKEYLLACYRLVDSFQNVLESNAPHDRRDSPAVCGYPEPYEGHIYVSLEPEDGFRHRQPFLKETNNYQNVGHNEEIPIDLTNQPSPQLVKTEEGNPAG